MTATIQLLTANNTENSNFDSTKAEQKPAAKSVIWRGIKVCLDIFQDALVKSLLWGAIGFAFWMLSLSFAVPFISLASSLFITRLAIKTITWYNPKLCYHIERPAFLFVQEYPRIKFMTFVFAIAISPFIIAMGGVAGAALGILSGITADPEKAKRMQKKEEKGALT
jgi:hypothetical protein